MKLPKDAPAPGNTPDTKPSRAPRNDVGSTLMISPMVSFNLFMATFLTPSPACFSMKKSNSLMANKPTIAIMKSTPSKSSRVLKV